MHFFRRVAIMSTTICSSMLLLHLHLVCAAMLWIHYFKSRHRKTFACKFLWHLHNFQLYLYWFFTNFISILILKNGRSRMNYAKLATQFHTENSAHILIPRIAYSLLLTPTDTRSTNKADVLRRICSIAAFGLARWKCWRQYLLFLLIL